MCGNHHHGTDDHAESGHWPTGPIFRPVPGGRAGLHLPGRARTPALRSRRAFLGDVGKGTLAMAVVTPVLAACSSSDDTAAGTTTTAGSTDAESDAGAEGGDEAAEAATDQGDGDTSGAVADELRWARANLGFVSAYVLARGNTAAIVDTGVAGSADGIGESLASLGLNYDDVDHVILTHKHGDHAGSIAEVLDRATGAAVYAGEADLGEIDADSIVALTGGEDVFGLEMLSTPGHTAGHMAVIDHTAGLLVAGDAIFTQDGGVVEGPERFFDDIPESRQTIQALAQLSFNTLLVGHGDPIEGAADTAVSALADSLP